MESFFKTLKVERICQTRYKTRAHARLNIVDWIEGYYNRHRMHTSRHCTPVEYETLRAAAWHAVRENEAGSDELFVGPPTNHAISGKRFTLTHVKQFANLNRYCHTRSDRQLREKIRCAALPD
ncbi:IS3 family transposase [Burkholderia diffusa]|uniref:IS3 family transposase n=1 Tax=Burkholderia diffusa TaxID=488732 RepID=UPI003AF4BCD5